MSTYCWFFFSILYASGAETPPNTDLPLSRLPAVSTSPIAEISYSVTGRIAERRLRLATGVPIFTSEEQTLVTRAIYSATRVELSEENRLPESAGVLHRFELSTLGAIGLAPDWNVVFDTRIIFASDFHSSGRQAWQPFVRLNLGFAAGPRTAVYAGAIVLRTNLGLIPLPSLGLVHRSVDDRWVLTAIPPRRVEMSYKVNDFARMYIASGLVASAWAVSSEQQPYRLIRNRIEALAGVRFAIADDFALELESGVTLLHHIEAQSFGGDTLSRTTESPGLSVILRLARVVQR